MTGAYENYDLLIIRTKQGDNTAWKQLYTLLYKHIFAFALQQSKNRRIAEDLVQEGFIVVFLQIHALSTLEDIRKLLYTVVRNKFIDYGRNKTNQEKLIDKLFNHPTTKENTKSSPLASLDLKNALETLPPKTRTVLVLSYFHGYKLHQIASIVKLSEERVKRIRIDGRKKLKKYFF